MLMSLVMVACPHVSSPRGRWQVVCSESWGRRQQVSTSSPSLSTSTCSEGSGRDWFSDNQMDLGGGNNFVMRDRIFRIVCSHLRFGSFATEAGMCCTRLPRRSRTARARQLPMEAGRPSSALLRRLRTLSWPSRDTEAVTSLRDFNINGSNFSYVIWGLIIVAKMSRQVSLTCETSVQRCFRFT